MFFQQTHKRCSDLDATTHNILWKLNWQCYCNVEITKSNLRGLQNFDTVTSNLWWCGNVVSTLDGKSTSSYIIGFVMATSIQRWKPEVKFTTSSLRRYHDIVPTLCQLCKERQMSIIHGGMVTFLQFFLKVVLMINKHMTFVWYTGSILWHQIQVIFSLPYSKVPEVIFKRLRKMSWSLTAWTFRKELPHLRFSKWFQNNYFSKIWNNYFITNLFKVSNKKIRAIWG